MTREILMTCGRVALVDDDDYDLVIGFSWVGDPDRHTVYARRSVTGVDGVRHRLSMHRIILAARPGEVVDHRDGDGLNNTRANIRLCSPAENAQRQHAIRGISRFQGVAWCKNVQKWQVRCWIGGKQLYVGRFDDEIVAALAYDAVVRRHRGEYALTNFGPEATGRRPT